MANTPAATEPLHFGTKALVDSLSARITRGFDTPHPSEPALVIGVFGEWGSGKSTLLDGIGKHFAGKLKQDFNAADATKDDTRVLSITVPIEFNAWRYERDEHLIVPLLKTAQNTLRKVFSEHRSARDKANDWAEGVLDLLADVTLAAGKGLDWAFKLFGALSLKSKSPGEMLDEFEKRRKKRKPAAIAGTCRLADACRNLVLNKSQPL